MSVQVFDGLNTLGLDSLTQIQSMDGMTVPLSAAYGLSDLQTTQNRMIGASESNLVTSLGAIGSIVLRDDQYLVKQYLYDEKYKQNPALDDTFAGAYDLKTLTGSKSRSDNIGKGTDGIDYTHFRLDQASSFNLGVHGVQGNVLVDLLDSAGNKIAHTSSWKDYISSGRPTGIETTSNLDTHDIALNISRLEAGDYYIKVSPYPKLVSNPTGGFLRLDRVGTDYTLTVSTDTISNLLPAEVDLGSLAGTRLLNGTLSDTNTSDIYRLTLNNPSELHITLSGMSANADVRFIRDYNNNGIVDSPDVLTGSDQWYGYTDGIYASLKGGATYFVQVNQGTGGEGKTINYNLGISTGDWYTQNLSDFGVIANARLSAKDGVIDRNEMISLLRETEDYGTIDPTEFADLQTVVSQLGYLMPDHVRVLSNKVVNGDPANANFKESKLGNLFAYCGNRQMEMLVKKWFLGCDRPVALSYDKTTTFEYEPVEGQLFQSGIEYTDVKQGDVGDCYFMASLAATALKTPSAIQNMFIDNGDSTFTVRFFVNGKADYVTVDRWLPTRNGGAAFAGWGGGHFSNNNNELWVALAEKAYAQINESGGISQDGTNSYNGLPVPSTPVKENEGGLNGGFGNDALAHITGRRTAKGNVNWGIFNQNDDIGRIIHAFNTNQLVVLDTNKADEVASNLVETHEYALVAYDPNTDGFVVYNPWGVSDTKAGQFKPGLLALTRKQIMDNFKSWHTTTA